MPKRKASKPKQPKPSKAATSKAATVPARKRTDVEAYYAGKPATGRGRI